MADQRGKTRLTLEMMRRGAVMIKEPCTTCNGVQLRYKGKVYCTSHDDLEQALQAKELSYVEVSETLRNMLLVKLKETMTALEMEKDPTKLLQLVSLITDYVVLLRKLEPPQRA